MRVVLAGRLSQLQAGQTGMESREAEMVRWARDNGHEVIAITEDWQSGTTPLTKRTDLKPWVTKPELLGKYDALVAYEGSRLSRGPKAMTNEIESWATRSHKMILTVRDNLRFPVEGTEGIIWDITHRVNHQQWLDTSRMYRNMQKHLKDSGYLVGRPCFGYRVICAEGCGVVSGKHEHHKTLEPVPAEAKALRQAAEHYIIDGWPLIQICQWLDAQGLKPRGGKGWHPKSLSQVFRNPVLSGRRTDANGRTVLKVESILDRPTWDKLQAKLDAKATRKGVTPSNTAMLTGIAFCAMCGGPMYRIRSGRGESGRYYYRCHGTGRAPSKCGNMYRLEDLETWVDEMFRIQFGQTELIERIMVPGHGHEDEIAEVKQDIRELDVDDPDYDAKHAAKLTELRELQNRDSVSAATVERSTGKTVGQHWATLDTAGKREFLLSVNFKANVRLGQARHSAEPGESFNVIDRIA